MTHVMLVGNPNSGKSTLFNALTGEQQAVGHWPGVTVEKKTGAWSGATQVMHITDLPGVYALNVAATVSLDAQITAEQVIWSDADIFINVIDACHLERHLYLTSQLLELGKPVVVALNMLDVARQQGITIDTTQLACHLGCPVIEIQANRAIGLEALQQAVVSQARQKTTLSSHITLPKTVQSRLHEIESVLLQEKQIPAEKISFLARRLLEENNPTISFVIQRESNVNNTAISVQLPTTTSLELDILIADARYTAIHQWVTAIQKKRSDVAVNWTAKLDRVVLHRFWAIPVFLTLLYVVFFLAVQVGGAFQACFDITTDALFVQGSAWLLNKFYAPAWLSTLISAGIGKGLNTTLTFIPVMAVMFFLLAFLESSGYMARAAFVMDKLMRALGISGKALIPLIVGFGCNVPAVMAARTLEHERERVLTVLMSPFMSCSARLSIYAVFVAAFFPTHGALIVFSLYLVGIAMAVLTGFLLRHSILKGECSPLMIELPHYHRPALRRLLQEMFRRLRQFVLRAGKLIIPVCMLLGGLNAWMMTSASGESVSMLAYLGQYLTPVFSPMGIQQENWPAVVGLLTGTLAKEVVIGSLNSLYAQLHHVSLIGPETPFNLWLSLKEAFLSIPQNLSHLFHFQSTSSEEMGLLSHHNVLVRYFGTQAAAYAYLLFVLLYIPCVSTVAAIRQETQSKYMWLSIGWSFFVAYLTAVAFYQFAIHVNHPISVFLLMVSTFILALFARKRYLFLQRGRYAASTA